MTLAHTDEQRLLTDNLRRFLDSENEFEKRRARLAASPPERLALWSGLADMGVIGAGFDERCGGFAGDARTVASIMAELGRSLSVEPYLGCAVVAGRILQHVSHSAWRDEVIGEMIAGQRICILAHDAGADPFASPQLTATENGDGYALHGTARCVRHADVAGEFLVSARSGDDTALFLVPRDAVTVDGYRLMDGGGAADLCFDGVAVDDSARLDFGETGADAVLRDALEWGVLAQAAETCGIVDALNTRTFEYLRTRKQFGVPIGTFQALQHRAADMYIAAVEIDALLQAGIDALAGPASQRRSALISALKATADERARAVGHEAIQMHGGMGVSDELDISHYGRRLATMRAELGAAGIHRARFAAADQDVHDILVSREPESMRAWRAEVHHFVEQHLPADIARKVDLGLKLVKDDYVRWQKVLREHGWFAGAWPQEHGGAGWDLLRQLLVAQESAVHNAPGVIPYGVNMVGPVLYRFGSEEQKQEHLPGILSSDVWWCQGYSEPGSGSDLASLRTSAVLDGDHYVVNGAKMWTTEAHWADWMHCLVRTGRDGKPQQGITFLLIDMNTPGIEIKPIVTIDGIHHTNAVFLDNVRVPVHNRVGEEGQGWSIAKFLLGNERISIADTGPKLHLLAHVRRMYAALAADDGVPAAHQALLADRLADVSIQLMTLCTVERQCVEAWAAGAPPGAEASLLKIRGTEILQAITEVALAIEGPMAAAHDPADLSLDADDIRTPAQRASLLAHEYLYGRCWSVFGGTNEIQRNIIARQVVG